MCCTGPFSGHPRAKQHDVLVIENDKERASDVANRLNVSVLGEDGTNPKNLAEAMRRHNPDMIISTLKKDDSNLFICLMAKRYDKDIITIASINDPDYMIETTSQGYSVGSSLNSNVLFSVVSLNSRVGK